MKQFQVMNPTTYVWRPVDEGEALSMMSTATDSLLLQWMPVGGRFTDADDFEFERLPDTLAQQAPEDDPRYAERLERIATAVLAGLAAVPNTSYKSTQEVVDGDVEYALRYAHTLIAKLDEAK